MVRSSRTDENNVPPTHQTRLALIAAGAALLGALIGGLGTFVATVYQSDVDRERSIRDERKVAYADMSSAYLRYLEAWDDRKVAKSPAQQTTSAKKMCSLSADLRTPMATVLVVGTDEASSAAREAVNAALKYCKVFGHGEKFDDVVDQPQARFTDFLLVVRQELR